MIKKYTFLSFIYFAVFVSFDSYSSNQDLYFTISLKPYTGPNDSYGFKTNSVGVHEITNKISIEELKKVNYDLNRIHVNVSIDPKDENDLLDNLFKLNLSEKLKNENNLKKIKMGCDFLTVPMMLYSKAEAEAVFYRDLYSIITKNVDLNDPIYKKVRESNDILIGKLWDTIEPDSGRGVRSSLGVIFKDSDTVDYLMNAINLNNPAREFFFMLKKEKDGKMKNSYSALINLRTVLADSNNNKNPTDRDLLFNVRPKKNN